MKPFINIVFLVLTGCLVSCGQFGNHNHPENKKMNSAVITNEYAREAFDAWQKADTAKWYSLFTTKVKLFDDGQNRDFRQFTKEAIGNERFVSIDKVEDGGKSIYGHFHSNVWGDFKTYFKFSLNKDNKINRLEIGKANY